MFSNDMRLQHVQHLNSIHRVLFPPLIFRNSTFWKSSLCDVTEVTELYSKGPVSPLTTSKLANLSPFTGTRKVQQSITVYERRLQTEG